MASLIEAEIRNNKQDFLKKDIDFYSMPNHLKPTLPTTEDILLDEVDRIEGHCCIKALTLTQM